MSESCLPAWVTRAWLIWGQSHRRVSSRSLQVQDGTPDPSFVGIWDRISWLGSLLWLYTADLGQQFVTDARDGARKEE